MFLHCSGGTNQYNQARQRNEMYKNCKEKSKIISPSGDMNQKGHYVSQLQAPSFLLYSGCAMW